uniref:ATP synthase subunit b n=1 Tax=Podarcis muralis TaxID=64176 RepID=A0A670J421_PODMU
RWTWAAHLLGARSARGAVQILRPLHTSQQRFAPVPPLPESGRKFCHGIFPEEIFQFLNPKTGVAGP